MAEQHHDIETDGVAPLTLIVRLEDKACLQTGLDLRTDSSILLTGCPEATALDLDEVTLAELEIVLEDATEQLGS